MGVVQGTLAYLKTFIVTLLVSACQPVDCGHRGLALELELAQAGDAVAPR